MRDPLLLLPDLRSGGRALLKYLQSLRGREDVLVLAIARAGVPVAVEVAKELELPLDVICLRRLAVHAATNSYLCAVNVCGHLVLDERLLELPGKNEPGFDYALADGLSELAMRVACCRNDRPAKTINGNTILLIDNGISSGQTVLAAIRALRTLRPASIILAVPVAAAEIRPVLQKSVDELICPAWHTPFGHVGLWYRKLDICPVERICELLKEAQ